MEYKVMCLTLSKIEGASQLQSLFSWLPTLYCHNEDP